MHEAMLAVLGAVVSIMVNNTYEKAKEITTEFIAEKQHRSFSAKIYAIIEKILNELSDEKYKNSEILAEATKCIYDGLMSRSDTQTSVATGLRMIGVNDGEYEIEKFTDKFYNAICLDDTLCKKVFFILNNCQFEQNAIHHNVIIQILNDIRIILENNPQKRNNQLLRSRTLEYAQIWNKNMFLNDFDESEHKRGINIKLCDVYLPEHLPYYAWKNDGDGNGNKNIQRKLSNYIKNDTENKMLLILGQPGIGKSTLITWIAANYEEIRNNILVYQFANDIRNYEWKTPTANENMFDDIIKNLCLDYVQLQGKVLILDGFDEIKVSGDRAQILNHLYWKVRKTNIVQPFSLIITCRENYINDVSNVQCDYITLLPWDAAQMRSFCDIYGEKNHSNISNITMRKLEDNAAVFGIPLLLYMILALNISVEQQGSVVDIFDQIFAINGQGGIYSRCINNKYYAEDHRIGQYKNYIHQVSREVALCMFENNPDRAVISIAQYDEICNRIIDEESQQNSELKQDLLLGNFYKIFRHVERVGEEELSFIHRSIYEYFIAEYIISSIDITSLEVSAGNLGVLLKKGRLSNQILEYINYKVTKNKSDKTSHLFKSIFQIMLKDGMAYHVSSAYKISFQEEQQILSNMLDLIMLQEKSIGEINNNIIFYLQCKNPNSLNLKGIILKNVDLTGANLSGANLCNADLSGSKLERANLSNASLQLANLENANLNNANLVGASLIGAKLNNTELNCANLQKVDFSGAELIKAKLICADLLNTQWVNAKLQGACLCRANLTQVALRNAYLDGANLSGAEVEGLNLNATALMGTIFDEDQFCFLRPHFNLRRSKVYVRTTNEILSFSEYNDRLGNNTT